MRKDRIYPRDGLLWFDHTSPAGKRVRQSTGFRVGQEAQARQFAAQVVATEAATEGIRDPITGLVTVGSYGRHWLDQRERRGLASVGTERSLFRHHVLTAPLAQEQLVDVRTSQLRAFVHSLRGKTSQRGTVLAPRTVLLVYGTLRTMFGDAKAEELVTANPCELRRSDLPKKVDSPGFERDMAQFTREEVEALISDPRIPPDRRALYALEQLTGMRPGEAAAVRWRDWDRTSEPLGRLRVARSYRPSLKLMKGTKTEVVRNVPVHPTLAKVLASWRVGGWAKAFGQDPTGEDLIAPARDGGPRGNRMLRELHTDLEAIGLRRRRNYDSRRTFISLGLAGGGSKDILSWITHGSRADAFDQYKTLPWWALCEQVQKLRVDLLDGRLLRLTGTVPRNGAQAGHSAMSGHGKAPSIETLGPGTGLGAIGIEATSDSILQRNRAQSSEERQGVEAESTADPGQRFSGDRAQRAQAKDYEALDEWAVSGRGEP